MSAENAEWYFMADGIRRGPITSGQAKNLIISGEIGPQTKIWSAGFSDWTDLLRTELRNFLPNASSYDLAAHPIVEAREAKMMGPVTAVGTCFAKSFSWQGRASRSEFWWWTLFNFIALFGCAFIFSDYGDGAQAVFGLLVVVLTVPTIAVTVRRLHDVDRSGWWYWISLVPFVGGIILLIFMIQSSSEGRNKFGEQPLFEERG